MDWISVPFPMTNSVEDPPPDEPADGLAVLDRLQPAKNTENTPNRTNTVKIPFFTRHLHNRVKHRAPLAHPVGFARGYPFKIEVFERTLIIGRENLINKAF
jgi:hypothetical protein